MRRFLIPALMISLLLSGCGENAAERKIEQQRDSYAAAEQLTFRAEITAKWSDEVFSCTLDCTSTAEEITVEVIAPESISGVTAHVRNGETEVEYENIRLSVGTAGMQGLHPMSAVPLLCRALKTGHVIRSWTEKAEDSSLIAAEIFADENYGLTLWFDSADLTPRHAELCADGEVMISCDFTDFQVR